MIESCWPPPGVIVSIVENRIALIETRFNGQNTQPGVEGKMPPPEPLLKILRKARSLQDGPASIDCCGADFFEEFGPQSFNGDHLNALSLLHFGSKIILLLSRLGNFGTKSPVWRAAKCYSDGATRKSFHRIRRLNMFYKLLFIQVRKMRKEK